MRTLGLIALLCLAPALVGDALVEARGKPGSAKKRERKSRGAKAPKRAGKAGKKGAAPVAAPLTPEAAHPAGLAAFEAGDYAGAASALALHTTGATKPIALAYFYLGRALTKLARYPEARTAFSEYLKREPTSPQSDTAAKLLRDLDVLESTRFAVTSTPPGANFALDAPDGHSADAPGELSAEPGPHKIFVTLAGYEVAVVDATANVGESVPVAVTLKLIGCDLTANVVIPASSATVRVDEGESEFAPGPVRIAPGRHKVEVASVGGEGTTQEVECKATEPHAIGFTVPAPSQGRISIALPSEAKLTVDGNVYVAREGNRALVEVAPGEHLIDIEAYGKIPWHLATMLHAGETLDLAPTLEAGGGATGVAVVAWPEGARVTVDGKPAKSGDMVRVGPGKHEVEVRAAGHFATTRTVEVIAGGREHVEVRLERRGRFLLYLGLAALPVAAAAEALALVGRFNAANELSGSPPYERWHALEVSGHVVAGAALGVAAAGVVGYFLQQRSGGEPTQGKTTVGAAFVPGRGGGGALSLSRSF